ncbi:hypothetical protein JW949_03355 [Candidatus Woesearchaeota archaeon]|nr:hypothetical protein [Candidatus Woesearchaeota archaeon]
MGENNKPDYIGDVFAIVGISRNKEEIPFRLYSLEVFIEEETPILDKNKLNQDFSYDNIDYMNYRMDNEENSKLKGKIVIGNVEENNELLSEKRENDKIQKFDQWKFVGRKIYDEEKNYYHINIKETPVRGNYQRTITADSKLVSIDVPEFNNKYNLYCDLFEGVMDVELYEQKKINILEEMVPYTVHFIQIRTPLRNTKYRSIINII